MRSRYARRLRAALFARDLVIIPAASERRSSTARHLSEAEFSACFLRSPGRRRVLAGIRGEKPPGRSKITRTSASIKSRRATPGVVVSDPDLVRDHRVILVDHRHHAEFQQGLEGGTAFRYRPRSARSACRQENLRPCATRGPGTSSRRPARAHLAHRGRRLQLMHGARPRAQPSRCMPSAMAPLETSTPLARRAQRRDLLYPVGDGWRSRPRALVWSPGSCRL